MKPRIRSIDCLRGLAILIVVLVHTTTRTLEASGYNLTGFTWTLILNQFGRFAVQLFFLISGFVLELNVRQESYGSFLKRRFSKIFIPYIAWSFFYYFLIYKNNTDNVAGMLLKGSASYQLYFIPSLCIFYLLFPLLHKVLSKLSAKIILPLIFMSEIYLTYRDYFVQQFDYPDPIHIFILAYFFFIVGIIAARNRKRLDILVKKLKYIVPLGALLAGIYVFWEGRSKFLATGDYLYFYSNWRPSTIIYTILISLALYWLFELTKIKGKIIEKFSYYSFFVYFIHVAILEGYWKILGHSLFNSFGQSLPGKILLDPIFFAVVIFVSILVAITVRKIPKLKLLTG